MTKPVILSVDDDPQVLTAVERDLRGHYGSRYRVLTAESGAEALEALTELQRRGTAVALLLVDQRMPGMAGTEFLEAVRSRCARCAQGAAHGLCRHPGGDRCHQPGAAWITT